MNLIFLYYDNPLMLRKQIECWNSYAGILQKLPTILLIDDGSPRSNAADVVRECGCAIPVQVFRIKEDIPWNFTGARNLGCSQSEEWIYVSDIDTLLPSADAQKLLEGSPLDEECYYIPKRVYLPDMIEARAALVNLLFHKRKYLEIGGYDEDYAGYYGKEETDFHHRLRNVARRVERNDVVIQVVHHSMVKDARTFGRVRDKTRNTELYLRKEAAGFIDPVNPLRFAWERVL